MNSYDLVDVYRTLHKDTRKYSWRRFNSTQRRRLDYLLVSEVLGLDITSADIMPVVLVVCSLTSIQEARGKRSIHLLVSLGAIAQDKTRAIKTQFRNCT